MKRLIGIALGTVLLMSCALFGNRSAPIVDAPVRVDAPVKVEADVVAELRAEIAALKVEVGQVGDRAGGNIWNIGTGGAGMAGMLLFYMLAERWQLTRTIKGVFKGRTCRK